MLERGRRRQHDDLGAGARQQLGVEITATVVPFAPADQRERPRRLLGAHGLGSLLAGNVPFLHEGCAFPFAEGVTS
jgi:hypothetical protein